MKKSASSVVHPSQLMFELDTSHLVPIDKTGRHLITTAGTPTISSGLVFGSTGDSFSTEISTDFESSSYFMFEMETTITGYLAGGALIFKIADSNSSAIALLIDEYGRFEISTTENGVYGTKPFVGGGSSTVRKFQVLYMPGQNGGSYRIMWFIDGFQFGGFISYNPTNTNRRITIGSGFTGTITKARYTRLSAPKNYLVNCDFQAFPFIDNTARHTISYPAEVTQVGTGVNKGMNVTSTSSVAPYHLTISKSKLDLDLTYGFVFELDLTLNLSHLDSGYTPVAIIDTTPTATNLVLSVSSAGNGGSFYIQWGNITSIGIFEPIANTKFNVRCVYIDSLFILYINNVKIGTNVYTYAGVGRHHDIWLGHTYHSSGTPDNSCTIDNFKMWKLPQTRKDKLRVNFDTVPAIDASGRHLLSYPAGVTVSGGKATFAGGVNDYITITDFLDDFRLQGDFTLGFTINVTSAPNWTALSGIIGIGDFSICATNDVPTSSLYIMIYRGGALLGGSLSGFAYGIDIPIVISRIGNNLITNFNGPLFPIALNLSNMPNTAPTLVTIGKTANSATTLIGTIDNVFLYPQ